MAKFKCTFVMQDTLWDTGFTHTWWVDEEDSSVALTTVYPYWQKLRALISDTIFLTDLRASNVDPPRDSEHRGPSTGEEHGTIDHTTTPILTYSEALLVRRDQATGNVFGHSFLHGVPIAEFTGRKYTPPAGTWLTAFQALVTLVTNTQFLLRKVGAGGAITYPICGRYIGMRLTKHAVGRPFDLLRGRRRIA